MARDELIGAIMPLPAAEHESHTQETGIAGALLQKLQVIPTPNGAVLHMLRPDYPLMPDFHEEFGELYFSEILPGCVKAWKRHKRQIQLFAVPVGLVRIALYDGRVGSPTYGQLAPVTLGRPDNYCLLRIPNGVWYGFQCLSPEAALICNCADIRHDPLEGEKMPPDWDQIPWNWV